MRLVGLDVVAAQGTWIASGEWETVQQELVAAIQAVKWPPGSDTFVLRPDRGRGRGQGNGVKPIKEGFVVALDDAGWDTHEARNPLRLDAVRRLGDEQLFGVEWETGNISSSHRAVNRILLGIVRGTLRGGALVVPTREMYRYLTDRIGNLAELRPYFEVWSRYPLEDGLLAILSVEQDGTNWQVPRIAKSTDGRSLV
jgi:hypothetical protein